MAKRKENEGILTFEAFLRSMYQEPKEESESNEEEEETSEDEYAFLYDSDEKDGRYCI
jgi:hypothetical protein